MLHKLWSISKKELLSFFSSPIAFIFLATFLFVNLFIFFWVETFFARNIADVRPLFEWMPILLIFLVSAITMRMWSEERRMGTIELLLTQPVSTLQFVLGKGIACLSLVVVALLLTLPIPITVSFLGQLDWGPVFGAYLATLCLAAAYISIGLTVSARSENQIVSLIGTVLVCSAFYVIGSDMITSFFGYKGSELLKLLGTGSRFSSITRGVIDIRDIYYYLSIVGIFLCLNVFLLEKLRWAKEGHPGYHQRWRFVTGLLIANFLVGNLVLFPMHSARIDVTHGQLYSISNATRNYLARLQEPLLIRGYFSPKTHPLLAPLVPQIRDLLSEFEIAGKGKIRVEFIDPMQDAALEEEAAQKFGVKPVPFQVADKYQSALVNSYFNVVVQYGDQYQVLGFQDLIEIRSGSDGEFEVQLRNPEYDLTRSIKKALNAYNSAGDVFSNMKKPVTFKAYFSNDEVLPEALIELKEKLLTELDELKINANGKFDYLVVDPDADEGAIAAMLTDEFGFKPMRANVFDDKLFYFYMLMVNDDQVVQVPLPETLDHHDLQRSVDAALKRFSTGFMKTIALATTGDSQQNALMKQMGMGVQEREFQHLKEKLQQNFTVTDTRLEHGIVPEEADMLMVVAPEKLSDKQVFAIDQFLMKGGTVVMATSPYGIKVESQLNAVPVDSGLEGWLLNLGLSFGQQMVLDPQNAQFPVPRDRQLGGITVQEIQMVEYPYFLDVRGEGLNHQHPVTASIPQMTVSFASPVIFDAQKNEHIDYLPLLRSSEKSWLSDSLNILPDFDAYPRFGFETGQTRQPYPIGVVLSGQFESYFKGMKSPLLDQDIIEETEGDEEASQTPSTVVSSVIEKSPQSAKLLLIASNDFLADQLLGLASSIGNDSYLNALQFMENTADWALEDQSLMSIRSRGQFSRTLPMLSREAQLICEYLNYGLALLGLLMVFLVHRFLRIRVQMGYQQILQDAKGV